MRCPNCGVEAPKGADVCSICGHIISWDVHQKENHQEARRIPTDPRRINLGPSLNATSGGSSSRHTALEGWSGLAAMLVAVLSLATVLLMVLVSESFGYLFILSLPLFVIALLGLRTRQAGQLRRLGRVGFYLAIIGTLLVIGFLVYAGVREALFFGYFLARWDVWIVIGAGVTFLVGLLAFGIATAMANVLPRWAAVMIAVGLPLVAPSGLVIALLKSLLDPRYNPPPITYLLPLFVGLGMFAAGLMRLGHALWAPGHVKLGPYLAATLGSIGSRRTALERWSGLAAILASMLIVALSVLLIILSWQNLWSVGRISVIGGSLLLCAIPPLLLATAFLGLQSRQAGIPGRLRWVRWVGFGLTMIGMVSIAICIAYLGLTEAFFGGISESNRTVILFLWVGLIGGVLSLVGLLAFGIATAMANVLPRWAAVMIAVGLPLVAPSGLVIALLKSLLDPRYNPPPITYLLPLFVGLGMFAAGLMRLGHALWAPGHVKMKLTKLLPERSKPSSLRRRVPQTGFADKTIWDWLQLLIVPIALALASYWFSLQQDVRQQTTDEQRADDAALEAYIDKLGQLMLDKDRPLAESEEGSEVRTVARSRTLTVLARLDGTRKANVVRFLYESGLIAKNDLIVDLSSADLSEVDLSGADLSGANLSDAVLSDANLSGANLSGAILRRTRLSGADLRNVQLADADLSGAHLDSAGLLPADITTLSDVDLRHTDLSGADLSGANLSDANLSSVDRANLSDAVLNDANLSGTNLSGANLSLTEGISGEKLEQQAGYLGLAIMPNGRIHAGSYDPTEFDAAYDLSITRSSAREGWRPTQETSDALVMEDREGGQLVFATPEHVFDPNNPSVREEVPPPKNAAGWVSLFKGHSNLDTSEPKQENNVGCCVHHGTRIDVTATSTPENYPRDYCGEHPCLPLIPTGGTPLVSYPSHVEIRTRFVFVVGYGQSVKAVIGVSAPEDKFDEFYAKAQDMMDSVFWN